MWAVRALRRYVMFGVGIVVYLPLEEHVRVVMDREVHARIRAYLLDLSFYRVSWKAGQSLWDWEGGLVDF
jgi:hypothetical protein